MSVSLRFLKYIFILIFVSNSFIGKVKAQEKTEDVKVGLVLSGGGAKGLAHIGVLKIIEEAGVRIDYIGGTSMGAIVGGLYASGYSAKQLDSIFKAVDFDVLIQDDLPRNAKTFYERENSEKYAITLPFDDFKVGLPKGLSKGQNFYNYFSRLTTHVSKIRDFNELPIPFFCMATNIETGKQILLDKGYLPQAVAASGALPSIFSPFELDGVLVTDGGVSNNYPIEEIKQKGAEIVIGVDVQDSLMTKSQINSLTTVLLQISNFRTINGMVDKIPATDVYIKPDIKEFSVMSFDKGDQIIASGEKAAFKHYEVLREIKRRQQPLKRKKIAIPKDEKLTISSVVIEGNQKYPRSYIKGKLKIKNPKQTTYTKLNEGINNLSATGNFDRVDYLLVDEAKGKKLIVSPKESTNKSLLRLAIHYDDLYKTGALINYTRKSLLFNNDVLSFDAILGDHSRYNFDYYIDKGYYWSIGLKHRYVRIEKDIPFDFINQGLNLPNPDGINEIDIAYTDFTTQLYVQTLLNQTFSVGLGGEHKRLKIITETFGTDQDQQPRTVFDDSDYWSVYGYVKLDTYDHKYFPKRGFLFDADLHTFLLSSDYTNTFNEFSVIKAELGYAATLFPGFSVNPSLSVGSRIGNTNLAALDFLFGGFGAKSINNFVSFYGYDFLEVSGNSFIKSELTLDYELFKNNHLNLSANFANIGEQIFSDGDWLKSPEYTGYAIGYGVDTFAGPVQVKYSYSPELSESNWYFSIGFWF